MPAKALLSGAGFNASALVEASLRASQEVLDNSIESLYPAEKYMVMVPLLVGTVFSICLAFGLAITYIPSVNTTILKMRCGFIQSLHDKHFQECRSKQEYVTYLTASIFWGALVSSVVFGGLIGLVIFFYLWNATAYYAMRLTAFLAGIAFITAFRIGLEKVVFTCALYKSFYRERPALANLCVLMLEWANFAVSAGFIFVRLLKFLGAASLYTGRLDTAFLSEDINKIGRFKIDWYPRSHLQAILAQEAHRHPYIEQLGVIYLMKLRYGTNFGNRASSCWRLIFVYALMPWLHKYRFATRQEELIDDTMGNFPVRRLSISFGEMDDSLGMASSLWNGSVLLPATRNSRSGWSKDDDMRRRGSQVTTGSQMTAFSLHSTNRSVLNTGEVLRLRESTRAMLQHTTRASVFRLRAEINEGWEIGSTSSSAKATEVERVANKRIAELEAEVELLKAALERSMSNTTAPQDIAVSDTKESARSPRPVNHPDFSNAFSV